MNTKRAYTMTARAEAVEATRRQILQAAMDLHYLRLKSGIRLEDIAGEARVSVQTVLRHFGSRDGVFDAAMAIAGEQVAEERRSPVGDIDAAVMAVVGHYEERGDQVMVMLAQEHEDDLVRRINDNGRRIHREWVASVFAPQLEGVPDHVAMVDLLVVATDVYTWKLLRRDRGLSRSVTEQRIRRLLGGLLGTNQGDD